MLIRGKIESIEVLENQTNEIKFTMKDNSTHRFLFQDGNIFFIVNENGKDIKYITLCENIDDCNFNMEEENGNTFSTIIMIKELTYQNNFKIQ